MSGCSFFFFFCFFPSSQFRMIVMRETIEKHLKVFASDWKKEEVPWCNRDSSMTKNILLDFCIGFDNACKISMDPIFKQFQKTAGSISLTSLMHIFKEYSEGNMFWWLNSANVDNRWMSVYLANIMLKMFFYEIDYWYTYTTIITTIHTYLYIH